MSSDRILLFGLLSFIFGIALGLVSSERVLFLSFLFPAVGLIFFLTLSKRISLSLLLCLGAVSFGIVLASQERQFWANPSFEKGLAFSGTARIVSDPERKDFFQTVELKQENCKEAGCLSEKILWEAPLEEKFIPGTLLDFQCSLERPKNFSSDFDYRMYLAKEGVLFLCKKGGERYTLLPIDFQAKLWNILYGPKKAFGEALEKSFPEPESGLAQGLLLGGSDHLSKELEDAFSRIGLSHIVSVSGYNITLVAELFLALGLFLGLFRKQALLLSSLAILLFVLLVGAPASAVRAGLMAGVSFFALETGRLGRPVNLLLLAATLMLFFNPLLLRYDIGFQLSFLATLAILFGAPWFERLFPKDFFGKKILEIAWLTLIIELFVVPLLLFHFQVFSWFSIIANIILLPLVPFAMALSFGSALLFLLWPGAHFLLSFPAYFFLTVPTRFAEFFGILPWVSLETLQPSIFLLFLWYALLIGGILILEEKQKKKWYARAFSLPSRR